MDLTPYYLDARNAITQPDKMVFLSQYFRRHWMPALGPLGTAVVIFLRGACYHNRRSGETRDTVQVSQREIAQGCGCSVPTIKRELERNGALRRFVRVSPEWERDGASGHVRQLENHYKVAMDDPLTEADEARLQRMVAERAAGERQEPPDGRRRKAIRTKAPERNGSTAISTAVPLPVNDASKTESSNAVSTANSERASEADGRADGGRFVPREERRREKPPGDQNELLRPGDQFESTPVQIELLYNESLLKTTNDQTLNVGEEVASVSFEDRDTALGPCSGRRDVFGEGLEAEAAKIAEELRDWGSERRHRQLLDVCERHNLGDLPRQALHATRERLARESRRGVLEKPGAYYVRVLLKLLQDRQVWVSTAAERDQSPPEEVRLLLRQSLGLDEEGRTALPGEA